MRCVFCCQHLIFVYVEICVLPQDLLFKDDPNMAWILKFHGTSSHPDTIILAREDYIDYEKHSDALTGILESLLITKHLLFVGFSLTDDHLFDAIYKTIMIIMILINVILTQRFF